MAAQQQQQQQRGGQQQPQQPPPGAFAGFAPAPYPPQPGMPQGFAPMGYGGFDPAQMAAMYAAAGGQAFYDPNAPGPHGHGGEGI
jgi:hypothetical protein